MSGSIGPVSGSMFEPNSFVPQTSASLNVSADTLAAVNALNSSFVTLNSASPNLSIFGYSQLVASAINTEARQRKNADSDDSILYKDVRYRTILSTKIIQNQIIAVGNLVDNYTDLLNRIVDVVKACQDAAKDFNNQLSTATNKWDNMMDAYQNVLDKQAAGTLTQSDIQNYINKAEAFNDTGYDTATAEFNAARNTYRLARLSLNAEINAINATITEVNQLAIDYNTDPSKIPYQIPYIALLPAVPAITPTPLAPVTAWLSVTPSTPLSILELIGPSGPRPDTEAVEVDPNTWNSSSAQINTDKVNTDFYKPLEAALKLATDASVRANKEIAFQDDYHLTFGQVFIGAKAYQPVGKEISTNIAEAGSNLGMATLGADQKQNLRLDSTLSRARLDALYQLNEIDQNSPIVSKLNAFTENILQALALKSIGGAAEIDKGALPGVSPLTSPAVGASVAISLLKEVVGLAQTTAVKDEVLKALLGDPQFAGKTDQELQVLAESIAAAINLNTLQTALLQISVAFGLTGLIPQLLAGIGTPSSQTIEKFNIGLLKYRDIAETPLAKAQISLAFTSTLTDNKISQEQAQAIVDRAVDDFNKKGDLTSEEQARDELRRSFDEALQTLQGENLDQAARKQLLDESFNRLNSQRTQDELTQALRSASLQNELKSELLRQRVDEEEIAKIEKSLQEAAQNRQSYAQQKQTAFDLLEQAGIDTKALTNAAQKIESPLASLFVQTPTPVETLATDLKAKVQTLLVSQGVQPDIAKEQSQTVADLILTGPTSAKALTEDFSRKIAAATSRDHFETAIENFKEALRPTLSTLAFLEEIVNPAKVFTYYTNPVFYGDAGIARTGPAGGVPIVNYFV